VSGASGLTGASGTSGQEGDSGSSGQDGDSGGSGQEGDWRLRTGGRLWREETETYRRPGAWRRHRIDWAVGENWSSDAQPWHHSSRLADHVSPDPPECRHRSNRAVEEHWRSGAYHSHLSLRLNAHIRRRRRSWTETAYWRPNALSRHNPPWLDAHSRMALTGGWHIAL
jgi:hypothetical protein